MYCTPVQFGSWDDSTNSLQKCQQHLGRSTSPDMYPLLVLVKNRWTTIHNRVLCKDLPNLRYERKPCLMIFLITRPMFPPSPSSGPQSNPSGAGFGIYIRSCPRDDPDPGFCSIFKQPLDIQCGCREVHSIRVWRVVSPEKVNADSIESRSSELLKNV